MSKTTINQFRSPLDIAHMLRNQPPALDHVLPGLLAKTVGLIVGPGAVSKTMLVLQLGIALATGTRLFGGLVGGEGQRSQKPERVVLVFAEELPGIVWHRLQAIASVQLISTGINPERAAQLLDENLVIHSLAGGEQVNLLGNSWERTSSGEMLRQACTGARLWRVINQFPFALEGQSPEPI